MESIVEEEMSGQALLARGLGGQIHSGSQLVEQNGRVTCIIG